MTTKQIVIVFAVLVLIGFIIGLARDSKPVVTIPTVTPQPVTTAPAYLCYYRSDKTTSGSYDRAWLRLTIKEDKITGEFNNYPAEKDSKVGSFAGTFKDNSEDGNLIGEADVVWDSMAEGMKNKEELLIDIAPLDGEVAFGEMVQGANGVYVYKDKTKVTYQTPMPKIDCTTLDEIVAVETYLKSADIATLTKEKAVLGGTFYMTSVVVNYTTDTALISYEDGHIAGKGIVTYTFSNGKVTVVSFTKSK